MKKTIKIPYKDLIELIRRGLRASYPIVETATIEFKRMGTDGDYSICELPDYIEIEIK